MRIPAPSPVRGSAPVAPRCSEFLQLLCDEGFLVSLETSGAIDLSLADKRVSRVMDLKTPGSGEQEKNLWSNLKALTANDQIKFVICSREDYEWAKAQVLKRQLNAYWEVLFSPVWGQVEASDLAEWILEDQLPVRFQLQLHKILWGDVPGK